eukprot:CAMPEP_0204904798 /NCGR_PEP_ID=MMETSP1397-20131031/5063_1 /ASSEMBLY_ACC=CAM_ASM_000891 /TAXON_ID=49980 /ORGANISM="Climacostomum Climacostomum virens, Strain Stock W-24" /LENGTH=277 /DNA_ID=CAMNT_0052073617 /DNA_START=464 /DNA_END=1297 /DNA_ORIENTATION=-
MQLKVAGENLNQNVYSSFRFAELSKVSTGCLSRHEVTPQLRSRLLNWMIEVMSQFGSSKQSLMLAIQILDLYMQRSPKRIKNSKYHCLGIVAMFIASKIEDVYPFRLEVVYEKIGFKKFSQSKLKRVELEMLKVLDFDLSFTTCMDVLGYICSAVDLPPSVAKTAELICVLTQLFYPLLEFTPTQQASSAAVIAATCLQQLNLLPSIFYSVGYSQVDLEHSLNCIYSAVMNYPYEMQNLNSAMKFLKFDLSLSANGPLFNFEDSTLQHEQLQLIGLS